VPVSVEHHFSKEKQIFGADSKPIRQLLKVRIVLHRIPAGRLFLPLKSHAPPWQTPEAWQFRFWSDP
jgi:hypothetical protein